MPASTILKPGRDMCSLHPCIITSYKTLMGSKFRSKCIHTCLTFYKLANIMSHLGHSQEFSLGGTGCCTLRQGRSGEGFPLPAGGGNLNFYIKMVSCRAFWVAISYCLAACFTRIRSMCGIEIY